MNSPNTLEALRNRVAHLTPAQRDALRVQLEARGIDWESISPSQPVAEVSSRLPLSPSQYFLWIYQNLYPGSPAYLISFQWHMHGIVDRDALERSFRHVVSRHDTLRTSFPTEDGRPFQHVAEDCEFSLGFSDLRTVPDTFTEEARAIGVRPFDLGSAPLLRAHLFRRGERDYTLVVAMHHIIGDGWSRGILMRELAACYSAFSRGNLPVLPDLSRRFGDFVRKQDRWLESEDCNRQKSWWQKRLGGLAPQELPSDRPRLATGDMGCETVIHPLPAALSAQVAATAGQLGTSSFVLLLATFKLLLHRYTGNTDIAVCIPVAGRRDPEAAQLIGLFTNTLVLRSEAGADLTFRQWVSRVQETFADSFEYQDFPFTRVLDALGVNREVVQNPLFQIAFQAQTEGYRQQNAEIVDLGIADLDIRQEILPLPEAKLDLSWSIMERESGYTLSVEYRTALFDADRMQRMVSHFEHLLGSVLNAPDETIPALDYMPPAERQALIDLGTAPSRVFPWAGLHETISQAAAQYPDAIALEASGRTWTYRQLDHDAGLLARRLLSMPDPIGPGARIAVALPRNGFSILSFIAILKAGATYVPLDPRHPADRIAYVLEDADVVLVLTEEPELFPGQRCIDPAALDHDAPAMALPDVTPSTVAYMLYTSGSTGRPKGVPIDHGAMLNQFRALAERPGIAHGDRMLVVTTPVFDISILEMLWPLTVGATVILDSRDLLFMLTELANALVEREITHLQTTPAYWRLLVDNGWEGKPGLKALCGGEALDVQLARKLVERTGELWNVYGPTEATIWVSALRVDARHLKSGKVPIGGLLDNTELHVLDPYMQPVPKGVPGELYIGGVCLSSGYWRRPALAAEKFVPHPFSGESRHGRSLYRTGDIAVRYGNGDEIEFVGRIDSQIKLRGYRIEVGEIESILQEETGVDQAIVLLDAPNERLIAYIQLQEGARLTDREAFRRDIRRRIAGRLPRYMVPTAFVLMEEFPLNPSGKVDRKRLPAPEVPAGETSPGVPRNDAERNLLEIWQEVLKRDDIGIEDNFFDLGGDSIIAMQIVARARTRGLSLTPTQIFDYQTVAAQAMLAQAPETGEPARRSLWQRHHSGAAHDPWIAVLPWSATEITTTKVLEAVAQHHGVLGLAQGPLRTEKTLPDDDTLRTWAREAASADGDMSWRAGIAGEGAARNLVISAHPLLLDGRSLSWLAADLKDIATQLEAGKTPSLPLSGRYEDWLATEPEEATSTPPADGKPASAEIGSALDVTASDKLETVARHLETTVETLVLAALAEVLLREDTGESVDIDVVTSARPGPALQRTVGNFTRLLAVRAGRADGENPAARALVLANRLKLSAPGQGISPSANTGAAVALVWNDTPRDVRLVSSPRLDAPHTYPLLLRADASAAGLSLNWCFDPARFSPDSVERLAARHLEALTGIEAGENSATARMDRLLARLGKK